MAIYVNEKLKSLLQTEYNNIPRYAISKDISINLNDSRISEDVVFGNVDYKPEVLVFKVPHQVTTETPHQTIDKKQNKKLIKKVEKKPIKKKVVIKKSKIAKK